MPEAEQVIRGLNSGNITVEQLVQQLANPALAQRQRDLILSVLKLRSLGAWGPGAAAAHAAAGGSWPAAPCLTLPSCPACRRWPSRPTP